MRFSLREIHRVLQPGGLALITTPNRKMSLTRNPWHIREYLPEELAALAAKIFPNVQMKGITGNDKVMAYYEENKRSVKRITRFDILNLQVSPAGLHTTYTVRDPEPLEPEQAAIDRFTPGERHPARRLCCCG